MNSGPDYLEEFAGSISGDSNNLKIAQINIRSLRNKIDEVKLLLKLCSFDILAITETYLDRNISNKQQEIDQYKIGIRRDRNTGSIGGGCLVSVAHYICFSRL